MRKITLLAATALMVSCFGAQTLTAQAAPKNNIQVLSKGNRIIVTYKSDCNIQNILDKLENCFPGISLPDCDVPEADTPEAELPENNKPENDVPESEHPFIKQVVELVNKERAKEGLAPLEIDVKVQAAAMVRAKECEQRFSHTRPNGSSFATALKEQNVSYRSAGENIAWGQRTPEEVVTAWMNSSGHRANIMNPNFTTIGVGYYENARGTDYWCQLFTR